MRTIDGVVHLRYRCPTCKTPAYHPYLGKDTIISCPTCPLWFVGKRAAEPGNLTAATAATFTHRWPLSERVAVTFTFTVTSGEMTCEWDPVSPALTPSERARYVAVRNAFVCEVARHLQTDILLADIDSSGATRGLVMFYADGRIDARAS